MKKTHKLSPHPRKPKSASSNTSHSKSKTKNTDKKISASKPNKLNHQKISKHSTNHTNQIKSKSKPQLQKLKQLKKHQSQIFFVLNLMASKIQRFWRAYLSRKNLKTLINHSLQVSSINNNLKDNINKQLEQNHKIQKIKKNQNTEAFSLQLETQLSSNLCKKLKQQSQTKQSLQLYNSLNSKKYNNNYRAMSYNSNAYRSENYNIQKNYQIIKNPETLDIKSNKQKQIIRQVKWNDNNKKKLIDQGYNKIMKCKQLTPRSLKSMDKRQKYLKIEQKIDFTFIKLKQEQQKRNKKYKNMNKKIQWTNLLINDNKSLTMFSFGEMDQSESMIIKQQRTIHPNNLIQKLLNQIQEHERKQKSKLPVFQNKQLYPQCNQLIDNIKWKQMNTGKSYKQQITKPVFQNPQYLEHQNNYMECYLQTYLDTSDIQNISNQSIHQKLLNHQDSLIESLLDKNNQSPSVISLIDQIIQKVIQQFYDQINQSKISQKILKKQTIYEEYSIINTDMQTLNNWLLQIAHFILDYKRPQIDVQIYFPQYLKPNQFLKITKNQSISYSNQIKPIISQQIIKHFVKSKQLKKNPNLNMIEPQKSLLNRSQFENTLKIYNKCLRDCLNQALNQQLNLFPLNIYNQSYMTILSNFNVLKPKIIINPDQSKQNGDKQILQKIINKVSQWGQANLGCLGQDRNEILKCIQREQINCLIDILDIPMKSIKEQGKIFEKIWSNIFDDLIIEMIGQLKH